MTPQKRLSIGIAGLDEILHGGLIEQSSYLVRGGPGTGKTTLGLHYLAAGAALGEKCLFITMEESESRIRQNAAQRGIDLSQIEILDISPTSEFFAEVETYDIFSPAEVEREPITQKIVEQVLALKPDRVFIDPMTQFRYLSNDAFQFRRQVISFLRYLVEQKCTVVFTSEKNASLADDDLQFMSDGVIDIDNDERARTIAVTKLRGSDFFAGRHTLKLANDGIHVFPMLMPIPQQSGTSFEIISSGIPDLDELLSGGIERSTVTIISGPSGVGKTTLGLQFMKEAAGRGERSIIYTFEEEEELMLMRCDGIGVPARQMITKGTLQIVKIEPLQYTPDEFAQVVRQDIANNNTKIIMLDSIAGFSLSLRPDEFKSRLHAFSKYLQNLGVALIIINEVEAITGDFRITEAGISYLADNVIFLRFLEIKGELRKAIGVLKKRLSNYEKTLREFEITRYGIKIGQPLTKLSGILNGNLQIEKDRTE